MDNIPEPGPSKSFITRGCKHTPRLYHKNDDIYDPGYCKFDSFDWLQEIPFLEGTKHFDIVEVRFKNSRKDFFRFPLEMDLKVGDIVAVESNPGHDIGIVSMSGELVRFQMRKRRADPNSPDLKKVYRRARLTDIEKWIAAVEAEENTLFRSRKIADRLNLVMKINDVEYQGDNTKATFYYTADDRVDFRELIKVLAEEFKVRIEMRQIGARQEASRLGGIGSCGRELCCSTWLGNFRSVTTLAARVQQLALNPQKLAGQCGKLKCCLNYEFPVYMDAIKDFPSTDIPLKTKRGIAFHQKTDVFRRVMWFAYQDNPGNPMAIPIDTVLQIIADNKAGNIVNELDSFAVKEETETGYVNGLPQEDLTRFDNK
jgi:cell fate regulator YaaT (PSP1 superfamily)